MDRSFGEVESITRILFAGRHHPKKLVSCSVAEFTAQEFVDLMNQVIDLKSIFDLPETERDALFDGT